MNKTRQNYFVYNRGGQLKLVYGPPLGKFTKNIDFLGHNITKNDKSRYGDVTNLSVFSILHALLF
jgi:hypothetical protein